MSGVYAIASNITSALGMDVATHWRAVATSTTGIKQHEDTSFSNAPFQASRLDASQWQVIDAQTRSDMPLSPFEQMCIFSARQALQDCDINLADTVFILSTTKGNIEWLGIEPDERIALHHSAALIAKELGISAPPIVISHACVSGVMALTYGLRLLQSGRYKHAVVTGADRFSKFVLKGFQSFQAVSAKPCRPFDAARDGISLGEAAATIILSTGNADGALGQLLSGASSNDANHISGPSRTGEELAMAITRALAEAGVAKKDIAMISAHGTATIYNDEMEAKAFDVAGLVHSPVHSFKGYVGHTLGAAGILESAMVLESLRHQSLIPSLGFENLGVPKPLNITRTMQPAEINYVLKTASGFGGSNAAIVWKRV